jgi:adenine phosphoribosyltransferase
MLTEEELQYLRDHIRQVPDFPKKGILFLDITTSVKDPKSLRLTMDFLKEKVAPLKPDYVVGLESRGFVYGAPLAVELGCGFIMVRKPNKLPGSKISESYGLEYGRDTLEIHADAVKPGDKVVIIDDLLATGGTVTAAIRLMQRVGAEIKAAVLPIELTPLKGREKIEEMGVDVISMLQYDLD